MNDKLNITTQTGANVEANIICHLENVTSGKRYLYYTLNEIVGSGANSTVKIYVSKLQQNDPRLDEQITEEEWKMLKDFMAEVLKGISNPNIKYISTAEITTPVSVSDKVIAMPVSYDYINKHRGVYAQAVATTEPAPSVVPQEEPTPIVEEPVVESAPVIEPVSPEVEPATVEMSLEPQPVVTETNTNVNMAPIDIKMIEQKYSEMIDNINKMKELELEAARRYNATLELNIMHNEQHASYIANEQTKETVEAPVVNIPVEPAAVSPIVPEPIEAKPANPTDIETNWFDMPAA